VAARMGGPPVNAISGALVAVVRLMRTASRAKRRPGTDDPKGSGARANDRHRETQTRRAASVGRYVA